MTGERVRITRRTPSGIAGYMTVFAFVDGGESGEYLLANSIIDTPREVEEILAQSADRTANRDATRAGRD